MAKTTHEGAEYDMDEGPGALELRMSDGMKLTVAPVKDASNQALELTFRYTFPHDTGHLENSGYLDESDMYRLYLLARMAVLNQVRFEDAELAAEIAEVQLREPGTIDRRTIPEPEPWPLVLERAPRLKVLDWRDMRVRSNRDGSRVPTDKDGDKPDWIFLATVVVHRTSCPKAQGPLRKPGYSASMTGSSVEGYTGTWNEVLPQVRSGHLVPTLCGKCTPLGEYTKFVNDAIPRASTTPPEQMPSEFPAFYGGTLNDRQRQWVWHELIAMDAHRWNELADLIEWAAAETDDTPATEKPHHINEMFTEKP